MFYIACPNVQFETAQLIKYPDVNNIPLKYTQVMNNRKNTKRSVSFLPHPPSKNKAHDSMKYYYETSQLSHFLRCFGVGDGKISTFKKTPLSTDVAASFLLCNIGVRRRNVSNVEIQQNPEIELFDDCVFVFRIRESKHVNKSTRWPNGEVSASGPWRSNQVPLKISRIWGLLHVKSYVGGQTLSCYCGAEVWRGKASPVVVLDI
ncbi:hypothetical protein AVEN_267269-1 [Araneus ventricosus]|uniref:Uncharacterized protein n=1 Tax=Araneus ventricosus TaxID=182803 RepID=A0A4Y2MB57_ARAVE|nr:hypothetical protein AVEN_267269-1 [Araneus ventricosus]